MNPLESVSGSAIVQKHRSTHAECKGIIEAPLSRPKNWAAPASMAASCSGGIDDMARTLGVEQIRRCTVR
jgi:hypothetical protein